MRFSLAAALTLAVPLAAPAQQAAPPARKDPRPTAGASRTITSRAFDYSIEKTPAWVVEHRPDVSRRSSAGLGNVRSRMFDVQISVTEGVVRRYYRIAEEATDATGLSRVSQIRMVFNPDYQKLVLHSVAVWRNGKRTDRTSSSRIELLQREQGLDVDIYQGDVTSVVLLDDVRVGDIVEHEYTTVGENPIFGSRFGFEAGLAAGIRMDEYHLRFLHPEARRFTHRVTGSPLSPATRELKGVGELQLDLRDVQAYVDEPDRPRWYQPYPSIQLTEYESWSQVSAWADPLFRVVGPPSPELAAKIAELRSSGPPRAQMQAALRFVQEEVRYLGIELRDNSHRPAQPNETLRRRYGDCKDKALLLTAIAQALGVKAWPALVSAERGRSVRDQLPSPKAFDHVIVMAELDGQRYWLDATRSGQHGDLDSLGFSDFGYALVVGRGSAQLEPIVAPRTYLNRVQITETIDVPTFREPALLTIETVLSGERAERARAFFASRSAADIETFFASNALRAFPSAKVKSAPSSNDDRAANRFTITESYELPELFEYANNAFRAPFYPAALNTYLPTPTQASRRSPFALAFPLQYAHTIVVNLPQAPPQRAPAPFESRGQFFSLERTVQVSDKRLRLSVQAKTLTDNVPASGLKQYMEDIQKAREACSQTLSMLVSPVATGAVENADRLRDALSVSPSPRVAADYLLARSRVVAAQSTADIDSGKLSDAHRAAAFAARAAAFGNRWEFDRATGDIDEAIKIAPANPAYPRIRGDLLVRMNRFDDAVAEFEHAAQVAAGSGNDSAALGLGPGYAHYYRSEYAKAVREFENELDRQAGAGGLYSALWRFIAARRIEADAARNLESATAARDLSAWPGPIVKLFLGRASAQEVFEAARSADKVKELVQSCEADFYVAQKLLIDGDVRAAREHFEKALNSDVRIYVETSLAKAEIGRLRGDPKAGARP